MTVDVNTGDVVRQSTREEAFARTKRIRAGIVAIAEWQSEVIAAFRQRDWITLGYKDWAAYRDTEYGESRIAIDREQRREIVAGMTEAGMSTRAIGSALGVDNKTVFNDQSTVENSTPARSTPVTGLDGREQSRQHRTKAEPEPDDDSFVCRDCGDEWNVCDQAPDGRCTTCVEEIVDAEVEPEPKPEPRKTNRRALPDVAFDTFYDLRKIAERVERLMADDRFPHNAAQIALKHRSDLDYAAHVLADMATRFPA